MASARNERETLIATIRSLLALRYPEFEVVVVNDGSDDDTLDQVRAAISRLPGKIGVPILEAHGAKRLAALDPSKYASVLFACVEAAAFGMMRPSCARPGGLG